VGQYFGQPIIQKLPSASVPDVTAPTFAGITGLAANADGSLTASWSAATDATPPIEYRVYLALGSVSAATLFATTPLVGVYALSARLYADASNAALVAGSVYTVGVRAADALGNLNTNTAVLTQTLATNLYSLVSTIQTQTTAASIAAAVWNAIQTSYVVVGSFGAALQGLIGSIVAAIKAKTDNLPASPANEVTVAAIKAKTDNLPASPANEVTVAAIKAKTDNLPALPANEVTSQLILDTVQGLEGANFQESLIVPPVIVIPKTGSDVYRLYFRNFPGGVPTDPAVGPTIQIFEQDGTTPIVASTAMTKDSDGLFYYDYTVTPAAYVGTVIIRTVHRDDVLGPDKINLAEVREQPDASTAEEIAAQVWDETTSGHRTAGSFGAESGDTKNLVSAGL